MKKIFAILLALVLVLSMSAMAASITITPAPGYEKEKGLSYRAYKIFDATISGTNVSYTISSSSPYYNYVSSSKYFTLTASAANSSVYVVSKTADFTDNAAETVADELAEISATAAATVSAATEGKYVFNNLADGYYLVTSTVGSKLILDTIGSVNATEKNTYPSLVKTADKTTAQMGATVTYTIKVTIPAGATGDIVVHDKMTGLKYNGWTQTNGILLESNPSDDCTVEWTLTSDYVKANLGETITITYTAIVTADTTNNEAYLVDNNFTSVPDDDNQVYNSTIKVNKYDANKTETKLAGATFVLKNEEGKYYNYTDETVTWVDTITDATSVTTDANGEASFTGLADGTYYLVETVAPAGYNLLTAPMTVTVAHDANDTITLTQTVNVENSTGTELPSTGGMGTTIFYVVGGLMVAAAIVLLVAKKKASSSK